MLSTWKDLFELHRTVFVMAWQNTHQITWQVNEISIIFVNQLNHSIFQELEINLQVLSQCFQLNTPATVGNKLIHTEIILQGVYTLG